MPKMLTKEERAEIRGYLHRIFSGKTAGVTCTKTDLRCRKLLSHIDALHEGLEAMASLWMEQREEYTESPEAKASQDRYNQAVGASVAVKLCADELRALLKEVEG